MRSNSFKDLLQPKAASQIGKLSLLAQRAVEGFITGLHKSPHLGFAIEFAEHRPYSPFDDIKKLDWLAYARTDKFFIKLDQQQTNLRSHIVLDATSSMNYPIDNLSITKFKYARYLAALLLYLMFRQQDAVGISIIKERIDEVPPSTKLSAIQRIFELLSHTQPEGNSPISATLHRIAERIRQRGIVIVISDLIEQADDLIHAIQHLIFKRQQLIIFHIVDPSELTLPFKGPATFIDPETGQRLSVNPVEIREEYKNFIENHINTLKRHCAENKTEYILANTSIPYDKLLIEYLASRKRIIKYKS